MWDSVRDGGSDELAAYLEHYPDGTFASLAQTRQTAADLPPPPEAAPSPALAESGPDALDLAFWESVKDSNRPEELTAYHERHPDGHFAGLARTRLAGSAEDAATDPGQQLGDAIELAFWEGVRDTRDPALLAAYLDKYSTGEFAPIAQARLDALRGSAPEEKRMAATSRDTRAKRGERD